MHVTYHLDIKQSDVHDSDVWLVQKMRVNPNKIFYFGFLFFSIFGIIDFLGSNENTTGYKLKYSNTWLLRHNCGDWIMLQWE